MIGTIAARPAAAFAMKAIIEDAREAAAAIAAVTVAVATAAATIAVSLTGRVMK
jgi:hypothetical protein